MEVAEAWDGHGQGAGAGRFLIGSAKEPHRRDQKDQAKGEHEGYVDGNGMQAQRVQDLRRNTGAQGYLAQRVHTVGDGIGPRWRTVGISRAGLSDKGRCCVLAFARVTAPRWG
jgi:hypothetical protein